MRNLSTSPFRGLRWLYEVKQEGENAECLGGFSDGKVGATGAGVVVDIENQQVPAQDVVIAAPIFDLVALCGGIVSRLEVGGAKKRIAGLIG